MVSWYRHPNFSYLISTDHKVFRLPGPYAPNGRLLKSREGDWQTLSSPTQRRTAPVAQLLQEAKEANPTPEPCPIDPTPTEVFLPTPDDPTIEVSSQGNIRRVGTHEPIPTFFLRGHLRVTINGQPRRVHNLVAHLFLPDRPPAATYATHISTDRTDNSVSNLKWVTPGQVSKSSPKTPIPLDRKTRRPLTPQQMFAILRKSRKSS